jgi:Na+-transporting NADH:ubiquinone oxidoreductase subunit NqrD
MVSIGAAVTLIAAGGILRFTVATTSTHGHNVHVVGLILILAGLLGLVLSLLVWVLLNRRRDRPAGDGRAMPPLTRQRFP